MPTIAELKKQLALQDGSTKSAGQEFYGAVDVFEGTTVNLRASLKGAKVGADDAEWVFDDKSGARDNIKIKLSAKTTEAVTVNPVADDKGSYKFTYKLKIGTDERKGGADFTVWPKKLHVTAKYKNPTGETHATYKDNDPVNAFPFKVIQTNGNGESLVSPLWSTDDKGVCQTDAAYPGSALIQGISPWFVVEPADQTAEPRKREVKVAVKPWKAKIHSPAGGKTADAPVKQLLNLAKDYAKNQGTIVKVEVGPTTPSLGKAGQPIKIRVTFDKGNSPRNSPFPALLTAEDETLTDTLKVTTAKPGVDDLVYEQTLTIPSDGATCKFYVGMGRAGGDKCKIEVGVTDTLEDDVLYLQNWRKYRMEMVQPEPDVVSSHTLFKTDKTIGLGSDYEATLTAELAKFFVEFDYSYANSVFYNGTTDIGNAAEWQIHDGAYFGKTAGTKVFTTTDARMDTLRASKLHDETSAPKDMLITVWADYVFDAQTGPISSVLTSQEKTITEGRFRFLLDPVATSKRVCVTRLRWRSIKKDGANWALIAAATDPGGTYRNWQNVALTEVEIKKWVEFVDAHNTKLKLPGPINTWLTSAGAGIGIQIDLDLPAYWLTYNAAGWHGFIHMTTEAGSAQKGGLLSTLLHEMGHNLGQAYSSKTVGPSYGLPDGKKIPGIEFATGVPNGFAYEGLGHTGLHCSFGLTKKEREEAVANNNMDMHGAKAKCVMFGSGDMKSAKLIEFCEDCVKFLKAIDGSSLKAHWNEP